MTYIHGATQARPAVVRQQVNAARQRVQLAEAAAARQIDAARDRVLAAVVTTERFTPPDTLERARRLVPVYVARHGDTSVQQAARRAAMQL